MPEYGAHAFLWIGAWDRESGDMAIRSAAASGFSFIEIPLLRPESFDADAHRKTLEEVGIGATVSLTLPEHAHMPAHPEEAKRFLHDVLDKAERLGATTVAGCLAYHLGTFTGEPPTESERQTVMEALGDVADDAARRGMTLGLEVCNRYETYLYNTLDAGAEAVRAIGRDNVMLHADTYHMNIEEEGFYRPLVDNAQALGYMHMSESHRGLVGTGTVVWDEVFRGLADAGYEDPLVLESFAAINPDLQAATKLWRPPNQPPGVLAEEGLAFLKERAQRAGLT